MGLDNIIVVTKKKCAGFNKYLAVQALVYFQDAEEKQTREIKILRPLEWKEVKEYFINEVARLKRNWDSL